MDKKNLLIAIILLMLLCSSLYCIIVVVPEYQLSKEEEISGQMMIPYNYTSRDIIMGADGFKHGQIGFYKTIVCPATNKTEDTIIYGDTIAQKDPNEKIEGIPRMNTVTFFYCTEHYMLFSYP
jgi:hypothetical protein